MVPAVAAYRNLMQKLLAEERAQIEAADLRDPAWRSVIALTDSGRPNGIGYLKPRRIALFYDASASARERR